MDNPTKAESLGRSSPEQEPQPPTAPEPEHARERSLPSTVDTAETAYDRTARYRFAEQYVKGRKTIELGSGTGYGAHSLSKFAENVLGVDTSEEAVAYAARHYETPNLRYEAGDVTNLPYPEDSFEAAVSFEVIEYLERPEALVEEALRLLKEDGIFLVSTPDKQTYSNDRNHVNPHHLKEMYPLEFRETLERHFRHVQIYRQGALAGTIITPDLRELPQDGHLTLESTHFSVPNPKFGREVPSTLHMIAVCTNARHPESLQNPHLILDCDRQVYEELADQHAMVGPLLMMYHSHQQKMIPLQVEQRAQVILQKSKVWRLRQKIGVITARAKNLLRRG